MLQRKAIAGALLGLCAVGCGSQSSTAEHAAAGSPSTSTGAGGSSAGTTAISGSGGVAGQSVAGLAGFAGTMTATGNGGTDAAGGAPNGGAPSGGVSNGGSAGSGGETITAPAGYTLVWHDEFDVDGPPDPKNYKFENGFVRNEEDQWYQTANASVQGGFLIIEARKETVPNPNYTGTGDWKTTRMNADYTSSSLNTSGLHSWQYGHFEMRASIPTDSGMWPAWWTLGVSGQWPSNGEIDIMEYYRSMVLANVACGTATAYTAKWNSKTKSLASLGTGWASAFHIWTMDWDDQNIVLALDGQQMNSVALPSMLNSDGTSPFKQKAYMLVNLALGGQNGGSLTNTTFPQRYEIDYLRVFQKQ